MDLVVANSVLESVRARRRKIAEVWYAAIAHSSFSPLGRAEICETLAELIEGAVEALLEEPFEPARARDLGMRLADLHFLTPEALQQSQKVLSEAMTDGLAAADLAALHPRLVSLLTWFGAGFTQRLRKQILVNQERIHGAVMVEYRQALGALQRSREELELRVDQRTRELAQANEALQHAEAELKDQVAARTAELTEANARLAILHELDLAIMLAREPGDVARQALLHLQQLAPGNQASVVLFDPLLQEFSTLVVWDESQPSIRSGRERMLELFTGQINELQDGRPLVIDDLRASENRHGLLGNFQKNNLRSLVNIPIIAQGRLLGSLNIGAEAPNAFRPEVVEAAEEVAISLAATLHNAHLMAALVLSEARYRTLVETSPDAVTLTDLDLDILVANQQAAQLHGYPRPELLVGKNALDLLTPEDRERARNLAAEAVKGRGVRDVQYTMLRADGSTFLAELNATLLHDAEGRPQAFLGVVRDITHRKQAEQALRQRASELEALYETSLEINAQIDPRSLLNAAVIRATALLGTEMGAVWLVEGDDVSMKLVARHHKPGVLAADINERVAIGEGLAGRVVASGEPLMVPDYDKWEGRIDIPKSHVGRLMGAPLKRGEKVLGVITVFDGTKTGHFSPEEEQLLTMLGAQAAIAIENVNLLEAERTARQTAEILKDANLAVTRTLDLAVVLDNLLDYLNRLVPYDSASVLLRDEEGGLVVHSAHGYEQWVNLNPVGPTDFSIEDNPIFREIFFDQRAVLIPDVSHHPGWVSLPSSRHVRCWMGLPLIVHEEVIGLFSLDKTVTGFFDSKHLAMAEALAAQAAVAVHNATLFDEVRNSRGRLQDLSRRLVAVQENERLHLARELHDEIGQTLTGMTLMLSSLAEQLPAESQDRLEAVQNLLNELTDKIDTLSLNLRPTMIDDLGLLPTLIWHTRRYQDQTGIQVNLLHTGVDRRFDPEVEIAVYRIIQEALTNVARHAGVESVEVRLWSDPGRLYVQVEDQGVGFDQGEFQVSGNAVGLEGMQERVQAVGGTLKITAAHGTGTALMASVPVLD